MESLILRFIFNESIHNKRSVTRTCESKQIKADYFFLFC